MTTKAKEAPPVAPVPRLRRAAGASGGAVKVTRCERHPDGRFRVCFEHLAMVADYVPRQVLGLWEVWVGASDFLGPRLNCLTGPRGGALFQRVEGRSARSQELRAWRERKSEEFESDVRDGGPPAGWKGPVADAIRAWGRDDRAEAEVREDAERSAKALLGDVTEREELIARARILAADEGPWATYAQWVAPSLIRELADALEMAEAELRALRLEVSAEKTRRYWEER